MPSQCRWRWCWRGGSAPWRDARRPTSACATAGSSRPRRTRTASAARLRDAAAIAPLPLHGGDGPATLARIRSIVEALPGARVVASEPGYLRVEFSSAVLRFVDDAEFWFDPAAQVVQVRSAARLGRRDFDVNRKRIETIRARLAGSAG